MPKDISKDKVKESPDNDQPAKRLVVEEQPALPKEEKSETQSVSEPQITEYPQPPAQAAEESLVKSMPQPEEETQTVSLPEEEVVEEKKGIPKWLVFVLGIILGGALGTGVVLGWNIYGSKITGGGQSGEEMVETVVPTQTPEVTVVPTQPELNRSNLKIRVENGGSTPGAAATAADYLKGLGYAVVSVGNSSLDVAATEVQITTDKKEYFPMLKTDLGSKYDVDGTAGELKSNGDYDALVIVNK